MGCSFYAQLAWVIPVEYVIRTGISEEEGTRYDPKTGKPFQTKIKMEREWVAGKLVYEEEYKPPEDRYSRPTYSDNLLDLFCEDRDDLNKLCLFREAGSRGVWAVGLMVCEADNDDAIPSVDLKEIERIRELCVNLLQELGLDNEEITKELNLALIPYVSC